MPVLREAGAARVRRNEEDELLLPQLGQLENSVGYKLRRAQLTLFARLIEGLKEISLRPGQLGVLMLIDGNPGLTQAEVCAVLGIQRANLVTLINQLEQRGIVERHAVAADRRANALHLTDEGHRLLRRAVDIHRGIETSITRRLGLTDRNRLLELLDRLASP